MYPSGYRYTKDHEWVRVEGGLAVVGITSFAAQELGEVVFVEPPQLGTQLASGDEAGSIESVKAVAEFYVPVSGEVVEVNGALADAPELLNEDPHGAGWIAKIRPSNLTELDGLMDEIAYRDFVGRDH